MPKKSNASTSCCATGHAAPATGAGSKAVAAQFKEFMAAASAPGALNARTKQALAIALSTFAKCESCLVLHIRKARDMGFSQDEIDEAAWMAIAFGGSPVMMFYKGVCDRLGS